MELLRNQISELLHSLNLEITQNNSPSITQELVLAKQHLEDARMRLGVAIAYRKGLDPWAHQVGSK